VFRFWGDLLLQFSALDALEPRCFLILALSSVQRRDGRRNTSTSTCPSTRCSHFACRNSNSCFSASFIHVRLALHRDPRCHLRPYCSFENSQILRRAARERNLPPPGCF